MSTPTFFFTSGQVVGMAVLLAIYLLLLIVLAILFGVPSLVLIVLTPLIAIIEASMNPVTSFLLSASRLFLVIIVLRAILLALLTTTVTFAVLWLITDIFGLTLSTSTKIALAVVVFLFVYPVLLRSIK